MENLSTFPKCVPSDHSDCKTRFYSFFSAPLRRIVSIIVDQPLTYMLCLRFNINRYVFVIRFLN